MESHEDNGKAWRTPLKLDREVSDWIDLGRNVRDEQSDVFVSRLLTETWRCLVRNGDKERITHAMVVDRGGIISVVLDGN